MLTRLFEWYRVVSVSPTRDTLDNRRKSIGQLVDEIAGAPDLELLVNTCLGIVGGFGRALSDDNVAVVTLVKHLKSVDPTVPHDLAENSVELDTCAAIAVGELLHRAEDKPENSTAALAGALLDSGLALRPTQDGKYRVAMLRELLQLARTVLSKQGLLHRAIPAAREQEDESDPAAELVKLRGLVEELVYAREIDREELDLLWWSFAETSETVAQPLSSLPLGAAALSAAVELVDKALMPPVASLTHLVQRAVARGRGPRDLSDRSLRDLVKDWSAPFWALLAHAGAVPESLYTSGQLLPLTWLCRRLRESDGKADWTREFEARTGIGVDRPAAIAEWSHQIQVERVAQRLAVNIYRDIAS
jgi:hypothetical protein